MASKVSFTTELVKVAPNLKGLVIGKKGKTFEEIRTKSGVIRMEMKDEGVRLQGTRQQIERAKLMILSIIHAKEHETSSCQTKDVTFDAAFSDFLIGQGGATVRGIQNETGTKIRIDRDTGVAHIRGPTEEHLKDAERKINDLVSQKREEALSCQKKDIHFPAELTGLLIGYRGETICGIKNETGTLIKIENGVAHITGPTQEHIKNAEQKINDLVSASNARRNARKNARSRQYPHRLEKLALIDGTSVGEDNYFRLQEINCDNSKEKYRKLVMEGEKVQADQKKDMDFSQLEEKLLQVLGKIRKEIEDSGNIRTDMWCHFGHVRIRNDSVDEADAGKKFDFDEINKNLMETEKNSPWKVYFKAGVEKLEYEALEEALKERQLKVPPNTRYDFTFYSRTEHQIRFKAFVPDSAAEDGCFSFQDDIVPVKNTLVDQSSYFKYRLCAPSCTRLKVDILIPYLPFDCHLVLRTTMREVKDVTLQEEDRILIDFLDDNLKYEDGNIVLPMDELPRGFSVRYRREAKRRTYPYSIDDQEFNIMISEEESQEESEDRRSVQDEVLKKTDIHVHCDAWDELLDKEDWEPEEIVSKLPTFLRFVREVQSIIEVPSAEADSQREV